MNAVITKFWSFWNCFGNKRYLRERAKSGIQGYYPNVSGRRIAGIYNEGFNNRTKKLK